MTFKPAELLSRSAAPPIDDAPSGIGTGRLIGVDLARGLAVLGMFNAHLGPSIENGGATALLAELTHGRSSALFAFLAGFAVVLITGRPTPRSGRAGRQAVVRVIIRALILIALGTALTVGGIEVPVILAFYGVYFLLVLPLYRLEAKTLALIAFGIAVVGPLVRVGALAMLGDSAGFGGPGRPDDMVSLLATGPYSAVTWLPYVLVGMAIARLDLSAAVVRARLTMAGVVAMVVGYGGSWLAVQLVPGARRALRDAGARSDLVWWSNTAWPGGADAATGQTPARLLLAAAHSETTWAIVGNTGVAVCVLVACLTVVERCTPLRRMVWPVIAIGSMSLTAYVAHLIVMQLPGFSQLPLPALVTLVVGIGGFAYAWSWCFLRGPLEWLMHKATGLARYVR